MTDRWPFVLMALLSFAATPVGAEDAWLPITPQELAMTQSPINPGAHALLLYREVDTDDIRCVESHYYRIKVFSETGKKYADVEIPYSQYGYGVRDIRARTVRPDGTIVKFSGEVFDRVLVKARRLKLRVKAFSLPEVQVGSILEYRFSVTWPRGRLNSPEWIVQDELPTLKLKLAFKPWPQRTVFWIARLPAGPVPEEREDGRIELALKNMPGYQPEEYMPPESEVKYRVDFSYLYSFEPFPKTPDDYWSFWGNTWYEAIERFIGRRKGIERVVTELIAPGDPADAKLFKIYRRVQQIRNLSYERVRTEKEEKREKRKANATAEDVLKNGYGFRAEINRLFVAMARAAGFEAYEVRVAQRHAQFFQKVVLNWSQLDSEVAVVKVGEQEKFFDPGTPGCPLGMLAWLRSGVSGIRPIKGGAVFLDTPKPISDQAVIERKGTFQLDESGSLRGKVQVAFHGLEALTRRLSALDADDMGRRKELEDEIKGWLPSGATAKLGEVTGWEDFDQPLRAEIELEVPDVASTAGSRTLLLLGVFQSKDTYPFHHAKRVHPIYLPNPYREIDDLTFEIPRGLSVESLPSTKHQTQELVSYEISRTKTDSELKFHRLLSVDGYYFPVESYTLLRNFFSEVKAGDEEQVVLQNAAAAQRDEDQDR